MPITIDRDWGIRLSAERLTRHLRDWTARYFLRVDMGRIDGMSESLPLDLSALENPATRREAMYAYVSCIYGQEDVDWRFIRSECCQGKEGTLRQVVIETADQRRHMMWFQTSSA